MLVWRRDSPRFVFWFVLVVLLSSALTGNVVAQDQAAKVPDKPQSVSATEAAPASSIPDGATTGDSQLDSALRLGVGDLVEVSVYNVPELASKTRIDSHGDVYLPLIDYVHIAGLTSDEAQRLIEKRFADGGFVKNPHVTLFVDEYASQGASVLGEVARPAVYPVLGRQRLFDLISAAGGFSEKAGRTVTITHRDQPDKPNTITLARTLAQSSEANVYVLPGDTIIVHRADIVYVVGDVARPSGFLIDRGSLTVLQAIALAGGTTRTSKLNGARIIHKGPNGMTETRVPLKKILQAKVSDMPMKADDILFVPSSAFKDALHNDTSIAMQAASLGLVAVR
jgi:polysaccharide export outer membrane protein